MTKYAVSIPILILIVLVSGCTEFPGVQSSREAEEIMRGHLSKARAMPGLEENISMETQITLKGLERAMGFRAESMVFKKGWKMLEIVKAYTMGTLFEENTYYLINETYYQCNSSGNHTECRVLNLPELLTERMEYNLYESLLNEGKIVFPEAPKNRKIGGRECTEIFYYIDIKRLSGGEEAKLLAMGGFNAMPNFEELKGNLKSFDVLLCITGEGIVLESVANIILDDSDLSNFSMSSTRISSHIRDYKIGAELPDSLFELPAESIQIPSKS